MPLSNEKFIIFRALLRFPRATILIPNSGYLRGKIMKKRGALIFLFVFLAFSVLPISGQTNKKAEIKRINAYVKTLDAFIKNKKPHLIFADISDENEKSAKWRKFASEKTLEKFREKRETYTIAYNWRKNGKIIQSTFTLFSSSGDWAQYDSYYFRADGTLAKIESELRFLSDSLITLRDLYFNVKGKLIRQTVRYRNITTEKPIKKPADIYFQPDIDIYKTVRRLPFAKLVK